jgi:hypothetical protein
MHLLYNNMKTSNASLRTRSALSHRNTVSGLSANYLFTQFQKVKQARSLCVFLSNSSGHCSLASLKGEGRTCQDLHVERPENSHILCSLHLTNVSVTHIDTTCNVSRET